MPDIDKLDPLTDGFVHYQLLRFCQATRLQYLNAHIPKYDLTSFQQAQFDVKITNALISALSHKDYTLGLHPQYGRQGGYRRKVLQMIEQWESRTNLVLQARFDPILGENEETIRISIVTDSHDRVALSSGFDTDWSYDND
jgi:hypothetical protein